MDVNRTYLFQKEGYSKVSSLEVQFTRSFRPAAAATDSEIRSSIPCSPGYVGVSIGNR